MRRWQYETGLLAMLAMALTAIFLAPAWRTWIVVIHAAATAAALVVFVVIAWRKKPG